MALDSEGMAHVVFGIRQDMERYRQVHGYLILILIVMVLATGTRKWKPFPNDLSSTCSPRRWSYELSDALKDQNPIGWMQDVDGNGTVDLNTEMFNHPVTKSFGASTTCQR